MMHEQVHCRDAAANHQLPIAAAFWIIQVLSTGECWSLMQNWMQIRCSTHLVILNATATQYTCSLSGVYHPHWLVQWSCHCSHLCIAVHSPWLPGYVDVTQTILIILTMVRLFFLTEFIMYISSKELVLFPAYFLEVTTMSISLSPSRNVLFVSTRNSTCSMWHLQSSSLSLDQLWFPQLPCWELFLLLL